MKKAFFVFLLVCSLCLNINVIAGPIDCSKAKSVVETLICYNQDLLSADHELAQIYLVLQFVSEDPPETRIAQVAWKNKRDKCRDHNCVFSMYDNRMREIRAILRGLPPLRGERFDSEEYDKEEEIYAYPDNELLGKLKCRVRVDRSPTVSFVEVSLEFSDSGQILSFKAPALKDDRRSLIFHFVDGWDNWGKGTFRTDGSIGILNLEAVRESEEPASRNILRMYGEYSLFKSVGPKRHPDR